MNKEIENLEHIHGMFRYLFDNKKYKLAKTVLKSFNKNNSPAELHTIVMLLHPFQNHEIVGLEIKRLNRILDSMVKKFNKEDREIAIEK